MRPLVDYTTRSTRKTMSYIDTFIQIAPDCPVTRSVVPVAKSEKKPLHILQYELLSKNPYKYTHEELLFQVHIRHKEIATSELEERAEQIRAELFQKKHPCLRASLLPKKFGWGVHYDSEGKIALYGVETEEYKQFVSEKDSHLALLYAMRNKRG